MTDIPATTSVPTTAAPTKAPIQKINYHGDVGDIIGIHVINILYNIITLGIYSFWGKTRIRRYMTSHLTLGKDAFQYTGTGLELFYGAIKALVIFVPLIILMEIPGINLIVMPFFLGMIAVAVYLAMRYRLSRTTWRGVHFSLRGSAKSYLWISIKRALKNVFSLGLRIPKSDIIKWTYLANHIHYGETACTYKGDYKNLTKIHYITMAILVFSVISGASFMTFSIAMKALSHSGKYTTEQINQANHPFTPEPTTAPSEPLTQPQTLNNVGTQAGEETYRNDRSVKQAAPDAADIKEIMDMMKYILLLYVGIIIGAISRLWYHVALWREKFRGLQMGNLRFKLDVTAPAMLKMYALNIVIIIFTAGLGKPITTHLMLRFFTGRLKIAGDIDALIVDQSKVIAGSGLGDALAADVGFDLGM